MGRQFNDELLAAWGELLSTVDWDLFCTFTYSESVWSTEKVARDFKKLHYLAAAKSAGRSKNNRRHRAIHIDEGLPPYILAIEPHKSGTLHAHVLLGVRPAPGVRANSTLSKTLLQETWQENIRHAGFTSITPVRKTNSATDYMVKTSRYCAKNPDAYLDWYGLGNRITTLPSRITQANSQSFHLSTVA
jgi:hypothetical protein